MGKIALEVERSLARRALTGGPGHPTARVLAEGDGWRVADVVCCAGPADRPFEEEHAQCCIAIVAAGSFQYRSGAGRALMTPGSLLLGSPGQPFACGHEHGAGDRCISFWYTPEYFERLAADTVAGAGIGNSANGLRAAPRVPPLRDLSPLIAEACAGLQAPAAAASWEEIGVRLAALAVRMTANRPIDPTRPLPPRAEARVSEIVRAIDQEPAAAASLNALAGRAGLSPYHFLRTFERVTGVTPHQYRLRARLREAALRLAAEPEARIVEIALDCGFPDLSNFNHTFRAEFGATPTAYRRRLRRPARGRSA